MGHRLAPLPERVTIVEVGPRDGLQNEPVTVPTEDKVRLISALVEAGLCRVEATSFVHPRWVPQLSEAEEVMRKVPRRPGLIYSALIPNVRGLDRALEVGEKLLMLWAERLKNCEASGMWPPYVSCVVPLDVPDEETLEFGEEV